MKKKKIIETMFEKTIYFGLFDIPQVIAGGIIRTLPRLGPQTWGGPRKPPTGCYGVEHP